MVKQRQDVVQNASPRALNVRDDNAQCTKQRTTQCAPTQTNTLRASAFMQGSLARYYRRRLVDFSEYHMCQQATAVDQPPCSPVFNMADDALDGFDVSGV